jgi:hypothetical protein
MANMGDVKRLIFEIKIKASAKHVWHCLWNESTYKDWTSVFAEGCYYKGELKKGSRVHFLNPGGSGMYSEIENYIENELLSIRHIGEVKDNEEMPLDAESGKWNGCFEIYRLNDNNGITQIILEVDVVNDFVDYMNKTFPIALERLKQICEIN